MSHETLFGRAMHWYGRRRTAFFAGLTVLFAGLFFLGAFLRTGPNEPTRHERIETGFWLPWLFETRGAKNVDTGVSIVGFDKAVRAEDYAGIIAGNEPLRLLADVKGLGYDRALFADVLDRLVKAGAREVIFDFVFEGPGVSAAGDRKFAEAIARHRDKVVLAFAYRINEREKGDGLAEKMITRSEPEDALLPDADPDSLLGFVNVWPDVTGAVSRMVSREDMVTLARPEIAATYRNFEDMSLAARAASKLGVTPPPGNAARIINFTGRSRTFPATPVEDLFTPDRWKNDLRDGAKFKDRVVIVGPYSELHYKDSFATPVGSMLGVEIQANCVWNELARSWIANPLTGWRLAAFAGLLLLIVFACQTLLRSRRIFGLPFLYVIVAHILFYRADVVLPLMPAVYAMLLTLAFVVFDFIHTRYEKVRIRGIFGTFLAPAVVSRLIESGQEPELGGAQVGLTAFFSDVQGFSGFAENLPPARLVEIMNEYLGAMSDVIEAEGGMLDKYIGDAIVAMFGAPLRLENHADRACACALRLQTRLAALRDRWAAQGDKWPEEIRTMRMRIGLNTGPAIVGLMGSELRRNYTMMGDTVNLAARCESGAKSAGVYILVSEDTAREAQVAGTILFRRIDRWRVQGRAHPVMMYEPVAFEAEASDETRRCVALYEEALELYFHRRFAEAKAIFEKARVLEPLQPGRDPGVEHSPSQVMAARCDEMLAEPPPAGWDGVCVMRTK